MMKPEALADQDYEAAAEALGCEKQLIKAFAEVESSGYGFLKFSDNDWRPKILFEALWFHKLTNGVYDKTHPNISSSVWDRSLYHYGTKEFDRLDEACALNRAAGLQAASWGKFQIMGFNYSICGFSKLQDFINAMYKDEQEHLQAFIGFIKAKPALLQALKDKDYRKMALYYNGAGAVDVYSKRLEEAYRSEV